MTVSRTVHIALLYTCLPLIQEAWKIHATRYRLFCPFYTKSLTRCHNPDMNLKFFTKCAVLKTLS